VKNSSIPKTRVRKIEAYLKRGEPKNMSFYMRELNKLPGPTKGKSLSEKRPDLIKEFHPRKNGKLDPSDISYGSHLELWWTCDNGHKPYKMQVKFRTTAGRGCPECGKLASIRSRSTPVRVFKGRKLIKEYSSISTAAKGLSIAAATVKKYIRNSKLTKEGHRLK